MSSFSVPMVQFIALTLLWYVTALAALMVVAGLLRLAVRKFLGSQEPEPNATTYPTEVPWV